MRRERTGPAHGAGARSARWGGCVLEDSDETLMLKAGAGDREAFRRLVERHLARTVAFAARVLGERAAAEDVGQETFLRVWTHASRWEPAARLTTWIHRVALNLCLDRLDRRREVDLDEIPEPRDPGPSPLARLQAREMGRHVNAALAQLPPQQRAALTLCHHQGLRNTETAEVMGLSVEAVESLLSRGRRTLRERLRGLLPELLGEEGGNPDE